METKYKIVRFYTPSQDCQRKKRTILTGLTLEQAKAHCNDPKTRKEGVYFDGFAEQK